MIGFLLALVFSTAANAQIRVNEPFLGCKDMTVLSQITELLKTGERISEGHLVKPAFRDHCK
jgi:hypothetical protein